MQKVESIRPGGTLAATFRDYPLPEFLLGVLRGNLGGRLQVELSNDKTDQVFFHNGVPICVDLPSVPSPLARVLVSSGVLSPEQLEAIERLSVAQDTSVDELLSKNPQLQPKLRSVRRRLPVARLERLFDHVEANFSFTEGTACPADAPRRVLQTLPLVFSGLESNAMQPAMESFLTQRGASVFSLATTYPRAVDPFQWGAEHEAKVLQLERHLSVEALIQQNVLPARALATLVVLWLSDMATETEKRPGAPSNWLSSATGNSPVPRMQSESPATVVEHQEPVISRPKPASTSPSSARTEGSGLVVHRRATRPAPSQEIALEPKPVAAPEPKVDPYERQYLEVAERLRPVMRQSYFVVLRIKPGSKQQQLERSYKYLLRRIDQETSDDGWLATRDLLAEAYFVLRDADLGPRYAALEADGDLSRMAFEAEPKVERAVRAFGKRRFGEARFLLEWAKMLDPGRPDVGVHLSTLKHLTSGVTTGDGRRDFIRSLDQEIARQPHDWRIKLCQAVLLAESGDEKRARALLEVVPRADHPLVGQAREFLERRS